MNEPTRPSSAVTRRRAVTVAGAGITGFLAGCLGGGDDGAPDGDDGADRPGPIDLSGGRQDDQDGMVIGEHFGPNGQVFYEDNSPDGHDNPARFHTLTAGLFPYHSERERRGWEAAAIYVTDYSEVDYGTDTVGHTDVHRRWQGRPSEGFCRTNRLSSVYSPMTDSMTTRKGDTSSSSHVSAGTFAAARDVRYVAGSDVLGGMGKA